MNRICAISGEEFEVPEAELRLRDKFGLKDPPAIAPQYRMRELGAFWNHWNLYRRKSDKSGQNIIAVFSEKCPYPVWHHKEWVEQAGPPGQAFNESRPIFEQMWDFFPKSPIPHNTGAGSQNCEYADDWWYSKNSYLCHSGLNNEDVRYLYRTVAMKDSEFCVFSFHSELCVDLANCWRCFEVIYAVNCNNCMHSAFLYDCRNCSHCLFCCNLRHKKYCVNNRQVTQTEYETIRKKWDFSSRQVFEQAKGQFLQMVDTQAFHRAQQIDRCENSHGDYLENTKNCYNCYFAELAEDCVNFVRGHKLKDQLDSVGNLMCELAYYTSLAQDTAYDIRFCFNVVQCRFLQYCGFCFQCEHCFGCCGLVGKKYCIFNTAYAEQDYHRLLNVILGKMKQTGEYGRFFPGYFAANPYDESWAAVHFPLTTSEQQRLGFRVSENIERRNEDYLSPSAVPDRPDQAGSDTAQRVFWDEAAKRPFKILGEDVQFSQKLGIPLPLTYYARRLQENFRWLHFDGRLRITRCAHSGREIFTCLPLKYDGRILSEEEYLKFLG
jgi:hypothetical protein